MNKKNCKNCKESTSGICDYHAWLENQEDNNVCISCEG